MKALVYLENGKIELKDVPYPKIKDSKDAIVEVKLSSICMSDIHITHGKVPRANKNIVLGHEFTGKVIEVGKDIKNIKEGNRVAANCITFCGECYFCRKGFVNNCEKGGWEIGCRINGCQAEYVRVPFADLCLNKIPDSISYEKTLFVGDILSSGYFGAELCKIAHGDIIAVIGAGPVGFCSMMSSRLFGASKIIAIDINEDRLSIAKEKGIADIVINSKKENVEEIIKEETSGRGVDGVIEAAGGENTFEISWKIARANSTVAIIAMYENPQIIPLNNMYRKNLTFKTGGVDAIHSDLLIKLIGNGKLDTEFLITHKKPLNDIVESYGIFEEKRDGCIKLALSPYVRKSQ